MRNHYGLCLALIAFSGACGRPPAPKQENPNAVAAVAQPKAITKPVSSLVKFASRLLAFHEELESVINLLRKDISLDAWRRKVEAIDDVESRIPSPPPEYLEVHEQCTATWKLLRRNISRAYEGRAEMRPTDTFADMDKAKTIGKTRLAALAELEVINANPQFAALQKLLGDSE